MAVQVQPSAGRPWQRRTSVRYPDMQRRGPVYYFRRAVPPDLRPIIGKSEIVQSLQTKDREEAKRLVKAKGLEVDRLFEQARRGVNLTQPEAEALARRWLERALAEDAEDRATGKTLPPDAIDERLTDYDDHAAEAREALALRDWRAAERGVELLLEAEGLLIPKGTESWQRLAQAWLRSSIVFYEILRERTVGRWREDEYPGVPQGRGHGGPETSPPRYPKGRPHARLAAPAPAGAAMEAETLYEVYAKWKAERRPAAKTEAEWTTAVRRFIEANGDLPVRAITRAHAREFKDYLLKRPGRASATASAGTVNKAIGAVAAVMAWAVKNDYADVNPFAGFKVRDPEANREKRLPYELADLKAIFEHSPVFTAGERPKAGAGEAAYWLPLLGLFTGARLEELGQALVSDVREEDGVIYLDLNTIEEGKSLKTKGSRRKVPIHPELIRCGFPEYVQERRHKGDRGLFPELRPDNKGKLTGNWSKWWGRYARQDAGITDRKKVFHSFRHTFKDACRAAGVEEAISDALTGHAGGGVGRTYGRGYPLAKLAEAIGQVRYPGLSLEHLSRLRAEPGVAA